MSVDDKFFTKIYTDYYNQVYAKIKRMLYSKVDDDIISCVQETYLKAWTKIKFLINHENVAKWLVTTAKNVAYDFNKEYLRKQKITKNFDNLENISDDEDFTKKIVNESITESILCRLSSDERILYELGYVQNLSNDKIGEILGITANAVASRNKRLIQKLKKDFL